MSVFRCKICGGSLEIQPEDTVAICNYCDTKQTLPRLSNDKIAALYDRANHFRRGNEFDKAMGIYEQILSENPTDAECYWSLVLCRYGIEYVKDPVSHKRLPTINRAQFTAVSADENYKAALQYADTVQRELYIKEAKAIDEIQKGILAISQNEEPFDVFICYKEADTHGRRTPDSVLAAELYQELTRSGFRTFFSRVTLEDKLGTAYEPYIFAALNSAKVMVVIGTKPEHLNAVWVKNEWKRYLALIKQGDKKLLIPAYRDMDPYDLPDEFSHLQAQDMSRLGFMQDLVRVIQKTVSDKPSSTADAASATATVAIAVTPLLKRAFMFLEDGDFERADEFCEQVLNQDPENAQAYLGKLLADLKLQNAEDLAYTSTLLEEHKDYQKAVRFADPEMKERLCGYAKAASDRLESERLEALYKRGLTVMQQAKSEDNFHAAATIFSQLAGYKEADTLHATCLEKCEEARKNTIYDQACSLCKKHSPSKTDLQKAITLLESIAGWRDSAELLTECRKRLQEMDQLKETDNTEGFQETRWLRYVALSGLILLVLALLFSIGYSLIFSLISGGAADSGGAQAFTYFQF